MKCSYQGCTRNTKRGLCGVHNEKAMQKAREYQARYRATKKIEAQHLSPCLWPNCVKQARGDFCYRHKPEAMEKKNEAARIRYEKKHNRVRQSSLHPCATPTCEIMTRNEFCSYCRQDKLKQAIKEQRIRGDDSVQTLVSILESKGLFVTNEVLDKQQEPASSDAENTEETSVSRDNEDSSSDDPFGLREDQHYQDHRATSAPITL